MTETTPLLHNSGWAPYASVTWNGPRTASGRSPEPEQLGTRWTLIKCGYRGSRNDPGGFATLLDVPEAETSRAARSIVMVPVRMGRSGAGSPPFGSADGCVAVVGRTPGSGAVTAAERGASAPPRSGATRAGGARPGRRPAQPRYGARLRRST